MKSTAICVTGWHFPQDFYDRLTEVPDVDLFVVSHKKSAEIPGFLQGLIPKDRILVKPNLGYDWGCYQQFLATGRWKDYQTIIFMHDDLDIHDFDFVQVVNQKLELYDVVGNGRGKDSVGNSTVEKHPYAYAHANWKPGSYTFSHPTVRGSFFAVSREVLESINCFEVYWDPFKIFIGFGNWSTKASCGKIYSFRGKDSFGFLSETFGKSAYLTEFIRGDAAGQPVQPIGYRGKIYRFLKRISTLQMEILYKQRKPAFPGILLLGLRLLGKVFSG